MSTLNTTRGLGSEITWSASLPQYPSLLLQPPPAGIDGPEGYGRGLGPALYRRLERHGLSGHPERTS